MNLPCVFPKLSLVFGTHLLACSFHVDRISQLGLADLDQTLLFEYFPLFRSCFFELRVVSFQPDKYDLADLFEAITR